MRRTEKGFVFIGVLCNLNLLTSFLVSGTYRLLMTLYLVATQVCSSVVPSADERNDWFQTFYRGVAFPTFARVLLLGMFIKIHAFWLY